MARTTPAQKPRGEHSTTFNVGFGKSVTIEILGSAHFTRLFPPRHGVRRPPLSSQNGCMTPGLPLYSGHFPIIIDDLKLRPEAGEA
jgi:hypothetical protein